MTSTPAFSAAEFAAKWRENARRENASSQEHFIDLCRLLGVPTPNEADPTGEWYTFEAGAERTSTGRSGRADGSPVSVASRSSSCSISGSVAPAGALNDLGLDDLTWVVDDDLDRDDVAQAATDVRTAIEQHGDDRSGAAVSVRWLANLLEAIRDHKAGCRAPMTDAAASRCSAGRTHQAPAGDVVR